MILLKEDKDPSENAQVKVQAEKVPAEKVQAQATEAKAREMIPERIQDLVTDERNNNKRDRRILLRKN